MEKTTDSQSDSISPPPPPPTHTHYKHWGGGGGGPTDWTVTALTRDLVKRNTTDHSTSHQEGGRKAGPSGWLTDQYTIWSLHCTTITSADLSWQSAQNSLSQDFTATAPPSPPPNHCSIVTFCTSCITYLQLGVSYFLSIPPPRY